MRYIYILIFLFVIAVSFQIFTGIWLFYEKYGFSPSVIQEKILGNPEKFINPASTTGLLKTAVPHILSISVLLFILFHFFYFTEITCGKVLLFLTSFTSGIFNAISNILVLIVSPVFSYLKLISFVVFEITIFITFSLIIYNFYLRFKKY